MGIRSWLGIDGLATAATFESPLTSEDIAASDPVIAAAFGLSTEGSLTFTREQAMKIPAVRRARQVICGTIGVLPLIAHRTVGDQVDDVTAERPVLTQPDRNTTAQYVLTWTVDDLLFYGISWWRVTSRDSQGYPWSVERLAPSRVRVEMTEGAVYVDARKVTGDALNDLIRFDGPDEGVLAYAGPTLTTTKLLEDAVRKFARCEVPLGSLALAEGAPELSGVPGSANDGTDRSEIDALLDSWEEARANRTTAYVNRAIEYTVHQFDANALQLTDGRNFQLADVARVMNLAPRYVNAPAADSMTYSTTEADRRDLLDTSLVGFITAIDQRLSMNDFTPRGTAVHFDVSGLLRGDLKDALEAAKVAVDMGAMLSAEVRHDVLKRAPLEAK